MYPSPIRVLLGNMLTYLSAWLTVHGPRSERGTTAVEYAMMAAGIAGGTIFAAFVFVQLWEAIVGGAISDLNDSQPPASSSPAP